jgi:hypothetical protein
VRRFSSTIPRSAMPPVIEPQAIDDKPRSINGRPVRILCRPIREGAHDWTANYEVDPATPNPLGAGFRPKFGPPLLIAYVRSNGGQIILHVSDASPEEAAVLADAIQHAVAWIAEKGGQS